MAATVDYQSLRYDPIEGDGKGFGRYVEAFKEVAKAKAPRPLEQILGVKLIDIGQDIRVGIVSVTPAMAWELLITHNTHNRPVSFTHAKRLASNMTSNRWRLTHQGGAFDGEDVIIDMQHRLAAIAMSGMTVPMVIFVGMDKDLFKFIDSGKTRSIAVTLGLAGHNGVSGVVGKVINLFAIPYDENTFIYGGMKRRYVSPDEVVEYLEQNPTLIDAAHAVYDLHEAALDALADKAAAVYVYWKISEAWGQDVADQFFELLDDGELPEKHPVTVLLTRIERHKSGKVAGKLNPARKNRLKPEQIVWLVAAAFRLVRRGQRSASRLDPRAEDAFPKFEDSTLAPTQDEAA